MAAKFIVKTSEHAGIWSNPFGRGNKWAPWKTVSKHDTIEEAQRALLDITAGLIRKSVWYRGTKVVSSDGRIDTATLRVIEAQEAQKQAAREAK